MTAIGGVSAFQFGNGNQNGGGGGSYPALPPMPTFNPPPPPVSTNTSTTNTTGTDPYLKTALGHLQDRYSADDTKRRIQDSNLGIEDAAALSAADQKGGLARRGLIGSAGASDFLAKNVYKPAQAQAAKAASDITLAQQQRLDNLTLGSTGLVTAPGQQSAENRRIAISQQAENAQEQQAAQQAQQSQVNQWLTLLGGVSAGGY